MDQVDVKIVEILKKDSRTKNVQIAKEVSLTEGAVRNRIEKLVKNGIISKFTIESGTKGGVCAIVMVKAKDETKKMMNEISKLDLSKEAYEISGDFDACAIVEATSLEELDEKIDRIRKINSVLETKTYISLKKW